MVMRLQGVFLVLVVLKVSHHAARIFFHLGFAVTFPNKLLYKNRQDDMHAAAVLLLTVLANFLMQLLDFCGVVLKSAANCHEMI